jgi:hypothetical protein
MAADAITPARKYIRLQFSLRMVMLLTAGVAVGLAIFRWPWETTALESGLTYTMRYHRGWNGAPLRHGLQTVAQTEARQRTRDAIYEDDVLRRERTFDARGQLATDRIHFPERGETVERAFGISGDTTVIVKSRSWDHGRRSRREWRTTSGTLLESIEYERQKTRKI